MDPRKDEILDEYLATQGDRAQLIKENILVWRRMFNALTMRSQERFRRGDSMVKYSPGKGQGGVLYELAQTGSATQAELSQRLGIKPQTLSGYVKKLEAAGLITRKRSKKDTRAFDVSLTSAGKKACQALEKEESYSGSMFEVFTKEELAQLKSLMAKLAERLEEEYSAAKAYDAFIDGGV